MDSLLKEQLVSAMMRFKKIGMSFPTNVNISMSELFLMNAIVKHTVSPDGPVSISDVQSKLHISKPAVSQMLNTLEQKGYIQREIDQLDRRKIAVRITDEGQIMLKKTREFADHSLDQIITRFGVENTESLIRLLTHLAEISEDLKQVPQRTE